MSWFTDRHCFLLAVIIYGISTIYSVLLWRKGFRQDNRVNYCLLLSGFLFHTAAMIGRGFTLSHCPVNNLYEAITFVAWTIVTVYLVVGAWSRLRFLGAFASPVLFAMGVFGLMPPLDNPYGARPEFINAWSSLHAALILLAYGAFGLSSAAGLMYLTQEHDLKFHKLRAIISLMPPIERLEIAIGRLLLAGFILLTTGLMVGAYYLRQAQGDLFKEASKTYWSDPKIYWSLLVWLIYLGLLLMRWRFAQTGRRFVWGAVGTFAFVLLTFWGTNLLSGIHQR